MDEKLRETRGLARTDLPPDAFTEIDDARPDDKPPAFVSQAVVRAVEGEGRDVVGFDRVTDEATGGMRIEADEEEESEMVRVPESLEALMADLVVGRGVHQNHDEQEEVSSNTTGLCVVNVQG